MIAANANAMIRTILFWFFLLKKFIRPPFRPLAGAAARFARYACILPKTPAEIKNFRHFSHAAFDKRGMCGCAESQIPYCMFSDRV